MARSMFADDARRLMLVLVALVLCGNEVQSQVSALNPDIKLVPFPGVRIPILLVGGPGLKFRLSQSGFDYAAGVALDLLLNAAQKISIPDQSGKASVLYSNANYHVTGMQVTGMTRPSSNVAVNSGSITWTLTNAGVSIRGNWKYDYKLLWFIPVRDSGTFTGSASGGSISLSVSLGLDSTGHPTITATNCVSTLSSVSIHVSGGASWLYNLFISLVEKPVRTLLQSKICEAATSIVNGNANRLLTSFPLQQTVATDYLFDYRFLSAPKIQSGFMETTHKAAFFYKGDKTEAPRLQASPFPAATPSSQMLTIWVSDYVPNTIGYVLYRQNIFRYTLTKTNIQNSYKSYLNTTCPTSSCFGTIFPSLSTQYPNAAVEAEMTATEAPNSTISSNGMQVTFTGDFSVGIRLANGSVVNLILARITLNVLGSVYLNGLTLKGTVTRIAPTVSNIRSSVGSVPESAVSSAINLLGELLIIPKLNEKGQQGISIPALDFVKFKDVSLEMQNRCVRIVTNVEKSP